MSNESFIKLRKLTTRDDEPIEAILERGVSYLQGLKEKATLQLRISGVGDKRGSSTHFILLTPSGSSLQTGAVADTKPTLVAIINSEAFYRVAEGSYSPVQAYLDGKLKLLGNVNVGKRLITHLAGSGTTAGVCPILTNESWKIDGPGFGSLTFTGEFFTHNGTVEIVYDWGGGFYQRIVTADSNGTFTITEGNLFCGDIPGHPGVGVIVTATDLATGQSTTQSYSTPC